MSGMFRSGMVAALVLLSTPSFAALDKCAALIESEGKKMQLAMFKRFQKCADAYHADLVAKAPQPPTYARAAATCEREIGKGIASGGDIDKEVTNKLINRFGSICTDSDLLSLGHLLHTLYGDNWARLQGVAAFHSAYENALTNTGDFINALIAVGKTGSCPSCVKVQVPLCNETSSKLTASSVATKVGAGPPILTFLDGTGVLTICDNTAAGRVSGGIIPSVPAATYYVLGGPGKLQKAEPNEQLVPPTVFSTSCAQTIRSEGIIQCGGAAQKINYSQCVDHMPSASNGPGTTSSGACSGTVCAASTTNAAAEAKDPTEPGTEIIGGACMTLNPTGGSAGDGFINLTAQIALAPPGDNCLNPATYISPGTPILWAMTTGTANARVLNQGSDGTTPSGVELDSDPMTGSLFNCSTLAFGQTSGVKLVGAVSLINALPSPPDGPGVNLLDATQATVLTFE